MIQNKIDIFADKTAVVTTSDPLLQDSGEAVSSAVTPAPFLSFEGTTDQDNADQVGSRVVPPDTEGDVGLAHYVQMNNLVFEVFDKGSGASVGGPFANNTLWQGFGGICESNNDGDPIVLFDHQAERWVFSQFALGTDGHQCVAVSTSSDPLGSYFLYDFVVSPGSGFTSGFNDYPKMGVWSDAYYLTANEFSCFIFCQFQGPVAVAFERDKMLNGESARMVKFSLSDTFFSLQPSHWEGALAPPAGAPNVFVMAFDDETWGDGSGPDGYRLWEFDVDWGDPNNSTFTSLGQVDTSEFDAELCGFDPCVPQQDGELLDTLGQFTMYRAQYRNNDSHQTIVLNHTVDVGSDRAGIRWVELRNTGSGWGIHQTGTFAPDDGLHRWMGSIAMDSSGNIALGYSVSGPNDFPSVRYTSRAAGDPLNEMPGGEVECHAGTGAQIDSSNRWGDYSTMSVDPVDGCSFWYTQEYYDTTASFDFKTRICAFTLPDCGGTCPDSDGDGFTDASCGGLDCNDGDPAIHPDATEVCDDAIDNNCDGAVDCDDGTCSDDPACETCPDNDGDGFTDASCGGMDCDDSDPNVNPNATEVCDDGIDNNCDGAVDCDDGTCSGDPACETCAGFLESCSTDGDCCSNNCFELAGVCLN